MDDHVQRDRNDVVRDEGMARLSIQAGPPPANAPFDLFDAFAPMGRCFSPNPFRKRSLLGFRNRRPRVTGPGSHVTVDHTVVHDYLRLKV